MIESRIVLTVSSANSPPPSIICIQAMFNRSCFIGFAIQHSLEEIVLVVFPDQRTCIGGAKDDFAYALNLAVHLKRICSTVLFERLSG
jgi:hypothetical protein